MLEWMGENLSTLLISGGLVLLVAAIVFCLLRRRRVGKSSCSGGCASCPMGGSCHRKN